jgi:superfamily II DNA/RNA helicase
MDQSARTAALDQFRKNEVTLLVASDVAARGLDIPAVSHIFNFDVPHHPDDYVHRIGRTGRAGRTGTAITVVAPSDTKSVAAIEKLIGQSIPWMGGEARASVPERADMAEDLDSEPNRGESRNGEQRNGRQRNGEHREGGGRRHGRGSQPRRDTVPAPVARLDDVRPRRAPKPAPQVAADVDDSAGHLPAFLLRPFRVKA